VRAVVLAGGAGTRIEPRLGARPKALAPFGGGLFIDAQLDWLAACGVTGVVFALGLGGNQIIEHLKRRAADAIPGVGWTVEPFPLGTAGALRAAACDARETFLVVNGDTLAEVDLAALLRLHRQRRALMTLAAFRVLDAAGSGRIEIALSGQVRGFREKTGAREAWVSGGVYLCEPAVLEAVARDRSCSLEEEVLPALLEARARVYALRCTGRFFDIGTPAGLDRAVREWCQGARSASELA
jgi:mannose-1-phosphate guanylyltransferase